MLLVAALVAALVFPRVAAGTIGLAILGGGAGAGLYVWRERHARQPMSPRLAGWIAIAIVFGIALYVFVPVFYSANPWPRGDWGPQHAVLARALDQLRDFQLPHWNHAISSGDAPFEVYPAFTYVLVGGLALATGMEHELPTLMIAVAIVVHTLQAINVTRLALRFLNPPVAAALGVIMLLDLGSISSGGVLGTVQWALLHTAVAQLFTWFALISIVDAIRRPRLRTSISIWVFTALSVMTHPAALLSAGVIAVALLVTAVLAGDVPRRRLLVAVFHVALGLAIGAIVWLPMGERILLYGQHFSNILKDPAQWLTGLFAQPVPEGSFAIVVFTGYAGILTSLWSRRAVPILVGACALVLLVALSDAPYLALDLAPSKSVARLGADRFYGLSRPFVFVAAGYVALILYRHVRPRWRGIDRRSGLLVAVFAGVLGFAVLRIGVQSAQLLVDNARVAARASDRSTGPLVDWAREQMQTATPDRWGRAYFHNTPAYYMHLTAKTGMPTFHIGPIPDVLLRERIEDVSPQSLRRFNVRWIVSGDAASPLPFGDPKTERKIGNFVVREIAEWDGKFARVERGTGNAVVTRLDDREVDVELRDTTAPALVALGTGYYPRWRAHDEQGREIPVYAYPSIPGGKLHVVAAWLPPGKTRFTPDGPLPSDGRGLPIGLAGIVVAIALVVVWRVRRWRYRVLREMARMLAILERRRATLWRVGVAIAVVALFAWGALASLRPARDLELGTGLLRTATISVRKSAQAPWQRCDYIRVLGQYQCSDVAVVSDTTMAILNDEQFLWAYTTPAIYARSVRRHTFDIKIHLRRHLAGRYWAGTMGNAADITISGEPEPIRTNRQRVIELADQGERDVTIVTSAPADGFYVTFVEESTLIPDRSVPLPPDKPAF